MGRAPTVLALARTTGGPYHGQLLAGLVRQVEAAGGRVVVALTPDPGARGEDGPTPPSYHLPVAWDEVDAVVSVALAADIAYLDRARSEGKSVVLAGHLLPGFDGPIALPDDRGGIRRSVEHLIGHGHTRIGFVGSMDQPDHQERRTVYRTVMAEHGLPAGDDLLFSATDIARSGGAAAAEAFLAAPERPTAVVAATGPNALGMMAVLAEHGVSVPRDLAVVGFGDDEDGGLAVPSLTTVDRRFDEVGALAGRLALSIVAGQEVPAEVHTVDATSLALRASCGCRADLFDRRTGQVLPSAPAAQPGLRNDVRAALLTMLDGREGTASSVDAVLAVVDDLLGSAVGTGDVPQLVDAITALAPDAERLGRFASVLAVYAQRESARTADGTSVRAARLGAVLSELESRGCVERSRLLESSTLELEEVARGLLVSGAERARSLSWLSGTDVRAGVLALWEAGTDGRLRISGVHDPEDLLKLHVGDLDHVRRFPPVAMSKAADGAAGEACVVLNVAGPDGDLGLLALLGRIDPTSKRETYYHWAELLRTALLAESLRHAATAGEERYAAVARAANDGLWEHNYTTGESLVSERGRDLLGVPRDGDVDLPTVCRAVHPEDQARLNQTLLAARTRPDTPIELELRVVGRSGAVRWLLTRALGIRDEDRVVRRVVGSISDVDHLKSLEEQLRQAALYDTVTGLPNRRLFVDRLELAMQRPRRRTEGRFAVLCLDLDSFKVINDSLGHLAGDELLRIVGRRLRSDLRGVDTAARFGGDEFAVLLTDQVPDDLLLVSRRIQDRIAEPVMLGKHEVAITASVGIAVSESGYTSAEDVLRDADIAMYRAKEAERGTAAIFDATMQELAMERLRTRMALAAALEAGQFVMHYQPIVDLRGGQLTRLEALVRWDHPERGLLLPGEFLNDMEGNATILTLGRWVLDTVCAQIAEWHSAGHAVNVSVNLSCTQFGEPDIIGTVRSALDRHAVPFGALTVEISESVITTDPARALTVMTALHDLGVRLHVDNVVSGHSFMQTLQTFPVDALKIDGTFVRDLAAVTDSSTVVSTIVSMSGELGIDVVAERVETPEQADRLREMGCTTAQGWLYAKALPAADVGLLLGESLADRVNTKTQADRGETTD
jgi:diguanylate cyclase (GGDEF)-like protein/PAS domain S-box-containing protein